MGSGTSCAPRPCLRTTIRPNCGAYPLQAAHKWASERVAKEELTGYGAQRVLAEHGITLSETQIRRQAASAPGKSPVKSGRKVLPAEFDKALVDLCVEMREMRLPIIKFMIIGKLEPDGDVAQA